MANHQPPFADLDFFNGDPAQRHAYLIKETSERLLVLQNTVRAFASDVTEMAAKSRQTLSKNR